MAEKKMRVVKRSKKNSTETVTEPVVHAAYVEPPVAPDAVPLTVPLKEKIDHKIPTVYTMTCQAGEYRSNSWIGLGWAIFTHRLWHLRKHGSFMD